MVNKLNFSRPCHIIAAEVYPFHSRNLIALLTRFQQEATSSACIFTGRNKEQACCCKESNNSAQPICLQDSIHSSTTYLHTGTGMDTISIRSNKPITTQNGQINKQLRSKPPRSDGHFNPRGKLCGATTTTAWWATSTWTAKARRRRCRRGRRRAAPARA
jgi:hypothetical protein